MSTLLTASEASIAADLAHWMVSGVVIGILFVLLTLFYGQRS